jgi:hypothetical protein
MRLDQVHQDYLSSESQHATCYQLITGIKTIIFTAVGIILFFYHFGKMRL